MTRLFLVPSFYGAVTWWTWLLLYLFVPLGWDLPEIRSAACFCAVGLLLLVSAILSAKRLDAGFGALTPSSFTTIVLLAGIGVSGILVHLYALAQSLHGLPNVLMTLLTRSFEIRWENAEVTSLGTQLSYAGWIACGLLAHSIACPSSSIKKRITYSLLWLAILLVNLAMVDRTRPFWIIGTSVLVALSSRPKLRVKTVLVTASVTATFLIALFLSIALWSGKIGEHSPGASTLEAGLINMGLYGTGGFAYFDRITTYFSPPSLVPERTLYPLFKLLAGLGIVAEPPSQILDFESVPHEVNVGTVLTPLYLDGGWCFIFFLFPVVVVLVDRLALSFASATCPLQRFAWAALCYAQFFAFFSSPLPGTPCWCFVLCGLVSKFGPVRASNPRSRINWPSATEWKVFASEHEPAQGVNHGP